MIITPIEHGLDLAHSYGHRSAGVHISDLYGSLYADLEPKRYGAKPDQDLPRERWGVGMALEDMLEEGLAARAFSTSKTELVMRPGEFETVHTASCTRPAALRLPGCGCKCGGGVFYSPDLMIYNGETRVGEIKLNSMSAKGVPWKVGETYTGFDAKFDKYFTQMKNYCFHVGTVFARLYSFSMREMVYFNEPKIFRAWDITFSVYELKEEWNWVLGHSVAKGLLT